MKIAAPLFAAPKTRVEESGQARLRGKGTLPMWPNSRVGAAGPRCVDDLVGKELPMTLWSDARGGEPARAGDLEGMEGPSGATARIKVVALRRAMPVTGAVGSRQAVLRKEELGPVWPRSSTGGAGPRHTRL